MNSKTIRKYLKIRLFRKMLETKAKYYENVVNRKIESGIIYAAVSSLNIFFN